MKIKTNVLKELISKVSVGIGADRSIPITELIRVSSKDGVITLETTDATNYVYATATTDSKDDFYVVVYAEQFVKLIGKVTSEYTEFEIEDGNLVITANGSYTVELPLDEDGEPVVYPDPIAKQDFAIPVNEVPLDIIKSAVQITKTALSKDYDDMPALTNYYVGDCVFATDGRIVAQYRENLFSAEPRLISPRLMDIISSITTGTIKVGVSSDAIYIEANDVTVYGTLFDESDTYETEHVEQYINTKFNNVCKVDKNQLISAIDRISLFVDKYDNRALILGFGTDAISVSNMKAGSMEVVKYKEHRTKNKKKFEPSEVFINADMLMEQLKAYVGDVVTIEHGVDFAIALVSENTTQIISLMSE